MPDDPVSQPRHAAPREGSPSGPIGPKASRLALALGLVAVLGLFALERWWFPPDSSEHGRRRGAGAGASAATTPLPTEAFAALHAVSGAWPGKPQHVSFNGHAVAVASTVSPKPMAEILSEYAKQCDFGALAGGAGGGPNVASAEQALSGVRYAPVARQEHEGFGAIVCAPRDGAHAGAGDDAVLPESGPVRYLYAETLADGQTMAFHIASEESAPIERLFPATGDAPGRDLEGAARPIESRRVLYAAVNGPREPVLVYVSPRAPADVLASYERDMAQRGWASSQAVAAEMADTRSFTRDGREIVVSFQPSDRGAVVAMKELVAPPGAPGPSAPSAPDRAP